LPAPACAQPPPATPPQPAVPPPPTGQPTPKPEKKPEGNTYKTTYFGSYRFRSEDVNWFKTNKADWAFTYATSLLRLGVTASRATDDLTLEIAQTALIGLPGNASGSGNIGNLGPGASYYSADHNRTASAFPKQAFVRFKLLGGNPDDTLRVGRFLYSDGQNTVPSDADLNYVKQLRVVDRLISQSDISTMGRSIDGIEFNDNGKHWNSTALYGSPTRGVYSLDGWDQLSDIQVAYLAESYDDSGSHVSSEGRTLAMYYADDRSVTKVDNRSTAAKEADHEGIHMVLLGGHLAQVRDLGPGRVDGLLWGVSEIGKWGELNQNAFAVDGELGYQLPKVAWKPWLRAYCAYNSGDSNPKDNDHGTFIPPLCTTQKFSPYPFYSYANLQDTCGQLLLRPTPKLSWRLEAHSLQLANRNDLWYTGGGAYEELNFGYSGRSSGGYTGLGSLYDTFLNYQASKHLTVTLFFGYARGGEVQASVPFGRYATYGYLELLARL
jgi:hypothetical protein